MRERLLTWNVLDDEQTKAVLDGRSARRAVMG
jgi:hypothetical protein